MNDIIETSRFNNQEWPAQKTRQKEWQFRSRNCDDVHRLVENEHSHSKKNIISADDLCDLRKIVANWTRQVIIGNPGLTWKSWWFQTPPGSLWALEEALTSYRSARQILEDRNELKGFAAACLLANMATLEADAAGDSCDSLKLFEEAKKLFQEAEALDTEEGADLLVNLAAQCLKTGEVDSALQHLHEAREIFQSNLLEDSLAGVKFWMNLGSALMQKGIQNESIESVESLSLARLCDDASICQLDVLT